MKLIDLEPRWIQGNSVLPMSQREQWALFEKEFGEDWNTFVVPMREETSWSISGTIPTGPQAAFPTNLTVTPSIDASPSGCWHGFITNGEIVG